MSKRGNEPIDVIRAAKDATHQLTETERTLRATHAQLVAERNAIDRAPKAAAECLANLTTLVDADAERFAGRIAWSLVEATGGYTELRPATGRQHEVAPRLPTIGDDQGRLTFQDLCGLVPTLVKSRLAEIIRGSGMEFGLPASTRAARLADLDSQITGLEAQHTGLVDAAAEVGISLPLLPTVQERRDEEARSAERERALAAERAGGIFSVSPR